MLANQASLAPGQVHKRIRRPADVPARAVKIMTGMLLAPPLLLLEAWRTRSHRYRHLLLTAFFAVYGATIGIAYDPTGAGADGVRHLLKVYVHYSDLAFGDFQRELWEILTFQVGTSPNKDVYIHVVSYFVGGVLGVPALFFFVIGTVYGYFFSGSMLIIFRDWGKARLPLITLFLIANFFLLKNIEGVNTVRTWTGLWVLVYGSLQYYRTRRLRYLVLMAMPPFIHLGYFVMALPAYAVLLFGSRVSLYAVLFILSSTTTLISPGSFVEVAATTERGSSAVGSYYREETADFEQVVAQTSGKRIWFVLAKLKVQRWALNLFIYTLLVCGIFTLTMNAYERWIASIGLLTLTLSNSLWFMYAIHNRAWTIGAVFLGAAFIMMRLRQADRFKAPRGKFLYQLGLVSSAVLFVPYFAYNLSLFLDYPSVFLLGAPFTVWLDPSVNLTIKEALRALIYGIL
ncbi:hypothetical protein [Rhodovulum bhavnagarense]|nr:hypothetical protein [Rhodovulum bhavnagarense]